VAVAIKIVRAFWRRSILALLLAAFLVPTPAPTHAEEVRALYAAQGLLCASDENDQPHRAAHCVLCLLPDVGTAPESKISERRLTFEAIHHPIECHRSNVTPASLHRARAPPFRFV